MKPKQNPSPVTFLCHAGEDNPLALRLGEDLFRNGIVTFVDDWEIRAGDSLRQKIDAGLLDCTHFLALLTPVSLTKEWVKAELDAAYIQKIQGHCKLICLRHGLPIEEVPPLLQGAWCPAIDDYENDFQKLLGDLYGASRRPPLGERPAWASSNSGPKLGLSPLGVRLITHLVKTSKNGTEGDPTLEPAQVRELLGRPEEEIADVVDELERLGFLERSSGPGAGVLDFHHLWPTEAAFIRLDSQFMPWNTSEDARTIASFVLEAQGQYRNMHEMAPALGWDPRRINPPTCLLVSQGALDSPRVCGTHPYSFAGLHANRKTSRFVRDNT